MSCDRSLLILFRLEGIIPALEPSHAVSYAMKLAKKMDKSENIVINFRCGDKDVELVLEYVKMKEKTRKKYDSNSKK